MAHAYYITSFRNLTLTEAIPDFIEFMPGMRITTDEKVRRRLLTEDFTLAAGAIESDYLWSAPNLVFGEFEFDEMNGLPPDRFLLCVIIWIDGLFRNGWLMRDHCMECDAAFLTAKPRKHRSTWTRNYLSGRPTRADGSLGHAVALSRADIEAWKDKHDAVETYRHDSGSPSVRFMMERGYARTGRALEFVTAARGSANLAVKIANYCSAMETLLTTDAAELAHKLAERAALFLGERGHDRRMVFATVKRAYNIRSKTVHGDALAPKQLDDLPALSVECDNLLRALLNSILDDKTLRTDVFDAAAPDPLEAFFQGLLLGKG